MQLQAFKGLKGRVSFNVPMSHHTTMRVGRRAAVLCQPHSLRELIDTVKFCRKKHISFLAIGNGSNIIVKDKGKDLFIIKLSQPFFRNIAVKGKRIYSYAGAGLNALCRVAESNGLGGCEFLIGIPGTVGGAIAQNAGAQGSSISDIIEYITILDKRSNIVDVSRKDAGFFYRGIGIKDAIVIGASFKLRRSTAAAVKKKLAGYIEKRLNTQDYTLPSAGCIFKNPVKPKPSAGFLIDKSGLKGRQVGGACISQRHANFIVNKKAAKAADVLKLISIAKDTVRKRFGIKLEEEVKII